LNEEVVVVVVVVVDLVLWESLPGSLKMLGVSGVDLTPEVCERTNRLYGTKFVAGM
jgi:hypothetical protein